MTVVCPVCDTEPAGLSSPTSDVGFVIMDDGKFSVYAWLSTLLRMDEAKSQLRATHDIDPLSREAFYVH